MLELVFVRLTRKYAEMINGVDLSGHEVGDQLQLNARDAALLIAEGWAAPSAIPAVGMKEVSSAESLHEAADHPLGEPEKT